MLVKLGNCVFVFVSAAICSCGVAHVAAIMLITRVKGQCRWYSRPINERHSKTDSADVGHLSPPETLEEEMPVFCDVGPRGRVEISPTFQAMVMSENLH